MGDPGPQGETGEQGPAGPSDVDSLITWNECTWNGLNSGVDYGLIAVNNVVVVVVVAVVVVVGLQPL